jgi:dolichyl-diphosphooligosaccharide--protein glycosyltransferase
VKERIFNTRFLIGVLIAVFFGIALLLRIFFTYHQVFVGDWIKFTSVDAYSYMRLVDNWAYNFPHHTIIDPYRIYPSSIGAIGFDFFPWLASFVIWIIGLGSPSQHTVDVVSVYIPVVLAVLTVIPAYFIGKALFNRGVGVLAAALMAVLPGEFMGRSILGDMDHHGAETLFSTTAILFLILAIKTAVQRQLTFTSLTRERKAIVRPLVFSALAGVFLAIYLLTWEGALLFVFISIFYFIVQMVIDHLRRKSSDYLGIIGPVPFFVALVICLPFSPARYAEIALVVALLIPVVLSVISRLMSAGGLRPVYYPAALIALGALFLVVFHAVAPSIFNLMLERFRFVFLPTGATATTTLEMQRFLSPQGTFSTVIAWGNFTTSFFLTKSWPIPGFAFISFVILLWLFIKRRSDEKTILLFFIWTLIMLVATLIQRRFAYYLVVNVALLSAYLSWQVIWHAGLKKVVAKEEKARSVTDNEPKTKAKKKPEGSQRIPIYHINTALAIIVVFFFVFFWNITKSIEVAKQASFAPSNAWEASLHWMRDNTPDPLGDPDAYYRLYQPPRGESFTYPPSAYGVTSWWDYGYWITRTARRLPSANPAQEPEPITQVAKLFLSREKSQTEELMGELKSSYIIADYESATSKFWAIITWAGDNQSKYSGLYFLPYQGKLMPVQVYYPEYYRNLLIRLYNFNGKAVTGGSPIVLSYEEKVISDGQRYRQVTDAKEFSSYKEALDNLQQEGSTNRVIIGKQAFISPIPLEAVPDFKLVYSSEEGSSLQDVGKVPQVKIFQYTGGR